MKYSKPFVYITLAASLALSSCSGLPKNAGGGNGGGGNKNGTSLLNITVTSTPSTSFSLVFFDLQIAGVAVTNNSGTVTTIIADALLPAGELVRLQSDSHYLGASNIAPGGYQNLIIKWSSPSGSFFNNTNATLLGCAPGAVCQIPFTTPGFVGGAITVPFSFTAVGGTNMGIDINVDLSKALTTASGMTFDLTQAGAITPILLPRNGQIVGSIDSLENYTGTVTSTAAGTVTVAPFTSFGEPRTFTIASNATFNDPFSVCPQPAGASCLAVNQNVSVDGVINADATFSAYEVDFLDAASTTVHELEGVIIAPPSGTQFQMLLTNLLGGFLNGNFPILPGEVVNISLNANAGFFVDPKNLGIGTTPLGFLSTADLAQGQQVMIRGLTQTGASNPVTVTSDRIILRYSSMGGTVATAASGSQFTLTGISPFFSNLTGNSSIVQTFANATTFDNLTSLGALNIPANVSVRALYLNPNSGATPPILAAKVRQH
jgi:hypothetical protein